MMKTPWGDADTVDNCEEGAVVAVSTPSHGGILVATEYAQRRLSEAARERGVPFEGWLAYEEDCDAAIVLFELPNLAQQLGYENLDERTLHASLSNWHPDFLMARGLTPTSDGYRKWRERQIEKMLRAEKSPDLIVSAAGEWQTKITGVNQVTTADGKSHLVTDASYKKAMAQRPIRLSNCQVYHQETAK